jgi:hypothetical protein
MSTVDLETKVAELESKMKAMKRRSDARKRHLRDMNNKISLLQAIADAAISDAARWKREADYWQLRSSLFEKEVQFLEAMNGKDTPR